MTTFQDVILKIPGLTHYYPLHQDARDLVGDCHGIIHGNVAFDGKWARFDGSSSIELPDRDDFSVAGTASKELSIVVFNTVDDWTKQSANNEYVHFMGKGRAGAHEFTFRYYIDGGGGEAPARKRRTSFYNFNPDGGLGTGSYFQDAGDGNGTERVITGLAWGNAGNGGQTQMWKNGALRDTDNLSDYDVYPQNTGTPVFLGSRGDNTGFLVGRLRRVAFFDRKLTQTEIQSIYNARDYAEGTGGGTGGGDVPPPQVTEIFINGEAFPVSGVNVARGKDQLVGYTAAYGSKTATNEWGVEVRVVGGLVTEILEQSTVPLSDHNLTLDTGSYVLSGHGVAKVWLLANATIGARAGFTDIVVPEPPPAGGCDLTAVDAAYTSVTSALGVLEAQLAAAETALRAARQAKATVDDAVAVLGDTIMEAG